MKEFRRITHLERLLPSRSGVPGSSFFRSYRPTPDRTAVEGFLAYAAGRSGTSPLSKRETMLAIGWMRALVTCYPPLAIELEQEVNGGSNDAR
jgi:hypothetical protein